MAAYGDADVVADRDGDRLTRGALTSDTLPFVAWRDDVVAECLVAGLAADAAEQLASRWSRRVRRRYGWDDVDDDDVHVKTSPRPRL